MMKKSLAVLAICMTGMGLTSQPVEAQSKSSDVPVNFPPSSYKGSQFVDNAGCVFVRAGYDGNVTWVPRMTRKRKHVCGQTPSNVGSSRQAAARPAAKQARKPVQITLEPAARPAAVAQAPVRAPAPAVQAPIARKPVVQRQPVRQITANPSPMPRIPVIAPRPAPVKPQAIARSTTATSVMFPQQVRGVPQIMRAQASKPVMAQPPRMVRQVPRIASTAILQAATTTIPGNTQSCYLGRNVRTYNAALQAAGCAAAVHQPQVKQTFSISRALKPQATPQARVSYSTSSASTKEAFANLPGHTRIMPRRSYELLKESTNLRVPEGYRPVWDDDRLNPYRAMQTVEGYRRSQKILTNTVPRRSVALHGENHKLQEPNVTGRGGLPYSNPGYDFN